MNFFSLQLFLSVFILISYTKLISGNKLEASATNEIFHKGSALKEIFNSFRLPTEFLEIEKVKKVQPTSLLANFLRNGTTTISQEVRDREELLVRPCTPDALPWLGQKGYCVPTTLLETFCGVFEASQSSDCPHTEGNWCCYKPTPAAPPVIYPPSIPTYITIKPCTPDMYSWMGPKGFCSSTEQLNEFCSTLEISASNRDCPGRENWCCYKPIPKDELYVQPCRPDAFPQLGRMGFCAATNQLNTFCNTLEISTASSDCASHPGNWCCYTPPPHSYNYYGSTPPTPTTHLTTASTTTSTPTRPATLAYPTNFCHTNPELPQCQSTTSTMPNPIGLPNYYAGTPPFLPCALFGYLPNCASTTSTVQSVPPKNSPVSSYNVYTNLKRMQEPAFNMRLSNNFGAVIDPDESVIFGREGF